MSFSSVDQKSCVIPFRLTPVKPASLVQHGTIQGSANECADIAEECGTVWYGSTRTSPKRRGPYIPFTLYVAGMEGMGMEGSLATFFSEGGLVDPQLHASSEHFNQPDHAHSLCGVGE